MTYPGAGGDGRPQPLRRQLPAVTGPRTPVAIACLDLRSAFNTGSIFRTADAARLAKVHLCGTTPFPPHDQITRTSRDTHKVVPWEYHADILALIAREKTQGVTVIAVETGPESVPYDRAVYPMPVLLVLGNEARGLPPEVLAAADTVVSIPMHGAINSLNVAVAAGIVVFEVTRRIGPEEE
jgi:23S rRNA (guanosine2251-2'-O)-methyltransferase